MSGHHDTVDELVESLLPYDHPQADQIVVAVAVMTGLARHVANATRHRLLTPTDMDRVVGSMEEMLRSLPRAVVQLADHLDTVATDDRLRTDSLPGSQPPLDTAVCAALALQEASQDLARAGDNARRARNFTSHLYWDDDAPASD